MSSVYDKISQALSSLSSRKRSQPEASPGDQGGTQRAAKRQNFRPWDQQSLHSRLETFRPLTWFSKPVSVGPVACASRGWVNEGRDQLCCEQCGAKLRYPQNVSFDQKQAAADLFAPLLTTSHSSNCGWRTSACSESLLAYTPPPSADLRTQFMQLQDKLLRVDVLPDLDLITVRAIRNINSEAFDTHVLGLAQPAPVKALGDEASTSGVDGSSSAFIIQPSKLTPQQKANLLALLGWDIDVLPADPGTTAQAMDVSSSYSLQHLLGRRSHRSGQASSNSSGNTAGRSSTQQQKQGTKHNMNCVVLKCTHCNSRVGLWNFSAVKPSLTGLFSAPPVLAASAFPSRALVPATPPAGVSAPGTSAVGASGVPAPEALGLTIAGGKYGLEAARAAIAPPSSAASARFGQAGPVFGIAALDAATQHALQTGTQVTINLPNGTQQGTAAPQPAAQQPQAPLLQATPSHKRAADEHDVAMQDSEGAAHAAKRARLSSVGSPAPATALPLHQPHAPMLDPVHQHRAWCPWIFSGDLDNPISSEPKFSSGWQHCLSALSKGEPGQVLDSAAAAAGPAAMQMDGNGVHATAHIQTPLSPATTSNARQLRDQVLDSIRKM